MDIEVGGIDGVTTVRFELRTRNDAVTLEYEDTVLLLFSPDPFEPGQTLIEFYESEGEYIRESVTVYIIDNDRKLTNFGWITIFPCMYINSQQSFLLFCIELEINFDQPEYSFTEGEAVIQAIKVQFRRTQVPFTLTLYPVSYTEAVENFQVNNFIIEPPQRELEMATAGEIC